MINLIKNNSNITSIKKSKEPNQFRFLNYILMFKLNWGENWFEEESIQVKIEIYEASEIEEKAKTKELSKPKNALDFTIDILDNVRVFRRAYIINEIAELNDALLVGICNIIGMNIRI